MTNGPSTGRTAEDAVRELYKQLLESWDKRNARNFALLFAVDGNLVGFDGTQKFGQAEIGAHLSEVFSHHQTAQYVSIVREVRSVTTDVTILSAIAGLIPPDKNEINPDLNAIQTMVAVLQKGEWKIALFQNTPAALHGRPEDARKLTDELREASRNVPSSRKSQRDR